MKLARSSHHYQAHPRDDHDLRLALKGLAAEYRRWGVDTFTILLRQRGWSDNHKRIYRVYCEEKLQVKRRKRRKHPRNRGNPLEGAEHLNEVWAMDFVSDQLANGRRIRALVILDVFSRECLLIEVDTSLGGNRVARALEKVIELRGCCPKKILSDNGPEFRSKAMIRWCYEWQVDHHFIDPGKPSQNGFVEGFNSTFRDMCLNEHLFLTMEEARDLIEKWRIVYNSIKPHSSLKKHTPESFAATQSGVPRTASKHPQTEKNTPDEVLS
jgi:putative transposase